MKFHDIALSAVAVLALAAASLAGTQVAAPAPLEPSIFSWEYWQQGGSASRSEIFRNFGLALIAFIGLSFGIWRAYTAHQQTQASLSQAEAATEQARIAHEGLFTDRFSRAVEHLGSDQLQVRIGGIYALWRLTQDAPEHDLISVLDILCAFVRNPPHPFDVSVKKDDQAQKTRQDVQIVLNLIGNKEADFRARLARPYRLDLSGANLRNADFSHADLSNADLTDADLTEATLGGADLSGAHLGGTNLKRAFLMEANLSNARLWGANLTGAIAEHAIFIDAKLAGADFTDAIFESADFSRANLRTANLSGADLSGADLSGADLADSGLTETNLTDARLERAINLTQRQLDGACIGKDGKVPTLPDGLNPPTNVCPED